MKAKSILNLQLPDLFLDKKDAQAIGGKFIRAEIVNNSLVITIEYEHGQFALWTYLQLGGLGMSEALIKSKQLMDDESKLAKIQDEFLI